MISKRTKNLPLCFLDELPLVAEARNDILRARPQEDARHLPLTSSELELLEYFHEEIVRARPSVEQFNRLTPQNQERFRRIFRDRGQRLARRQRREVEKRRREAEAAAPRVVIGPGEEEAQEEAFRLRCTAAIAAAELQYPRRPPDTPESHILQRGDWVTITNAQQDKSNLNFVDLVYFT